MVVIKNQFARQEIIHGLLGVSKLHLTKQELLDRINEKLTIRGFPPIQTRTLNNDLTWLKDSGAQIHVPDRRDPFYYYLDAWYPEGTQFDEEDVDILRRGIQILKGMSGFRIARDIEDMLSRMKYSRYIVENVTPSFIAFEDHTLAAGTEWLDHLAESIQVRQVQKVHYEPFRQAPEYFLFHPYFLKEYRNRWFIFGRHQLQNRLHTLALDRIKHLKGSPEDVYLENDLFDPETYFRDMIGVTRKDGQVPETVRLIVYEESSMHVETKKIHHSQKLIQRFDDGSIEVELFVVINYELTSTILGFGSAVKVLGPENVVKKMKEELGNSLARYKVS